MTIRYGPNIDPAYYLTSQAANDGACNFVPLLPRDYQEYGIERLIKMRKQQNRDAPGLGKTMQAAYAANVVGKRILVAAPTYLVDQWYDWLRGSDEKSMERNGSQVWPNVDGAVVMCKGNRYKRIEALRTHARWTIINHEMMRTHLKWLLMQKYDVFIFDESHHGRNRKADKAKGALELASQAEYVFELTATAIYKEADDLYMQFKILQPAMFTSYNAFVNMFMEVDDTEFGLKVTGVRKEMMPELTQLLEIMGYGRDYKAAGRALPPVIEKYVKVDLPPHIRAMYNQAVNEYRIQAMDEHFTNWMSVFHTLRRIITGTFKVEAVKELLADEVRKAVIFCWYKDTVEATADELGRDYVVTADGDDSIAERRIKALGDKHVVATISSLSEGIDLSDARTVCYLEENWTPGSNYQAVSRVVRERQGGDNAQPVIVYYVHCKNTIDEVIHRRSKARSGTVKDLIKEALYL